MNTQTDTPLTQHAELSTPVADKPRRIEVPTVEEIDEENEPTYDGSEAMQNMWQRNSY